MIDVTEDELDREDEIRRDSVCLEKARSPVLDLKPAKRIGQMGELLENIKESRLRLVRRLQLLGIHR